MQIIIVVLSVSISQPGFSYHGYFKLLLFNFAVINWDINIFWLKAWNLSTFLCICKIAID